MVGIVVVVSLLFLQLFYHITYDILIEFVDAGSLEAGRADSSEVGFGLAVVLLILFFEGQSLMFREWVLEHTGWRCTEVRRVLALCEVTAHTLVHRALEERLASVWSLASWRHHAWHRVLWVTANRCHSSDLLWPFGVLVRPRLWTLSATFLAAII